jgi:hypothetical protein
MFSQAACRWTHSRDVPASLEFLLPSQHLAKPSRVSHGIQALAKQQTLTSPAQMIPLPITYPPSFITSLIPSFKLITTYRFLDDNTSPSLPAHSLHLAAAATSSIATPSRPRSLAHLLSLTSGAKKTQRLARQRAVGSSNTNLIL